MLKYFKTLNKKVISFKPGYPRSNDKEDIGSTLVMLVGAHTRTHIRLLTRNQSIGTLNITVRNHSHTPLV
jgi:hypothetical protein